MIHEKRPLFKMKHFVFVSVLYCNFVPNKGQICGGDTGAVCCSGYIWNNSLKSCEPCEVGFFGPNCKLPCEFPSFGKDCQSSCECLKGSCICNKEHGDFTVLKSQLCSGSSGVGCCPGYAWNPSIGTCEPCKTGFFGPNCENQCKYPSHGKNCQLVCNCSSDSCSHIYGCNKIFRACDIGLTGPNCAMPCQYPSYGNDCDQNCSCSIKSCHHAYGCMNHEGQICSGNTGEVCCSGYVWNNSLKSCEPCGVGFFGPNCKLPCEFPSFGKECQSSCKCSNGSCICNEEHGDFTVLKSQLCSGPSGLGCCTGYAWNPSIGTCEPCKIGFFGPNCKDQCKYPSYGGNCQLECKCSNDSCSHIYGCDKISEACDIGLTGPKCAMPCQYPSYGKDCQLNCSCSIKSCHHVYGCLKHEVLGPDNSTTFKEGNGKHSYIRLSIICLISVAGGLLLLYIALHVFPTEKHKSDVVQLEV